MSRIPRVDVAGEIYHVINRANARLPIFFKEEDYKLFEAILIEAQKKVDVGILAYCLMPNHFHLVLQPRQDNDLQKFMQWLTLTHTQRWHMVNGTVGAGHLYQGRYKSFLIQGDKHLLTVIRYVEQNPLRAKLVSRAENWNFSSLANRLFLDGNKRQFLAEWPIEIPEDYLAFVNAQIGSEEKENIENAIIKSKPFGAEEWVEDIIEKYKLKGTTRKSGRPKNGT